MSAPKKFLIFSQKSLSNFQETELSYIFFKKFFLYFRKGLFRTRSMFRTLVYSEPEVYPLVYQANFSNPIF